MNLRFRFPIPRILAVLAAGSLIAAHAQSDAPRFDDRRATVTRPVAGRTLTPVSTAAPAAVVGSYLRAKGATAETVASLQTTSQARNARTGITHVRMEQVLGGLPVYGAYVKAAVTDRGELTHLIENIAAAPVQAVAAAAATELQALRAALTEVHPGVDAELRETRGEGGRTVFAGGAFFHRDPAVTRVAVRMTDGSLRAGYLVETWTQQENLLHHTLVGGGGEVLFVELRTANDSYNVFVEDPLKGPQTIVAGPGAGNPESPIGWLGAGTQTTINILGNNVRSYLDTDANNSPDSGGSSVSGGNFVAAVDLSQSPSTAGNRGVAVQNLFYLNNVIHDILYRSGFDEAAGNFQDNNFGKGGAGSDSVLAEAQDGSGLDNANFATPADGSRPRMQMYLWTGAGPDSEVVVSGVSYKGKVAQFGPALTTKGVTGALALANDRSGVTSDACEAMPRNSLKGKVAVVDRGTCSFTVKIRNAQAAGAAAVVMVNNTGSTEYFSMGGSDSQIRIPSIMVGLNDGGTLKTKLGTSATERRLATVPLRIDGDLDADIVAHEYGHGLTWRMIGGMSGPLAGAIGEGASDTLAFLINGDDAIGEYAASNANGIRRNPYGDYPRTYRDVTGTGVHADGEIYAATMWRLRELYEGAGLAASEVLDDFVDGMNFTQPTPAFEDMRDGMLASVGPGSPRACLIWQAFAAFGIGEGASGTVNPDGTVTIVESSIVPTGVCP